jgi:apolipoprotein D and lipocalin family protein
MAFASAAETKKLSLKAVDKFIDLKRFMGAWYVIANIPIPSVEEGLHNGTEIYSWDEEKQRVDVLYKYTKPNKKSGEESKVASFTQKAVVVNKQTNAEWKLTPKFGPFFAPISFPYLIADCAEDYSTCIIGLPDRSLLWVMARTNNVTEATREALLHRVQELGFNMGKVQVCVHTKDIADKEVGWNPGKDGDEEGGTGEEDTDGVPEEGMATESPSKSAETDSS